MEVFVTKEQREAAKQAAQLNYWDKIGTPDRAGWTGGKCPVSEYWGKVAELGAANFLKYDWHKLCLFSLNPADYTRPDIADWDIKAGTTFSRKDIAKGVKYILWVQPVKTDNIFYCKIATCKTRIHSGLSGMVEIRGWTDTADVALCEDKGEYFRVTPAAMRTPESVPVGAAL